MMKEVGTYVQFRLGGLEYFGYIKEVLENGNYKVMFGEHYQLISEIREKDIKY